MDAIMLPLPAGREASSGGSAPLYVRHRPECTLLYQLVEEYYPAFKAHLDAKASESEAPRRPPCRAPPQLGLFDETG